MYLNLVQLSESFGVSEKVVEDWIRDERLPYVADRGRLVFDRARVALWAAEHGLTARAGFLASENGAFTSDLALAPMLRSGGIWRDIPPSGVVTVLERAIAALPKLAQPVRGLLTQRLRAKGGINWAPVGDGFALPHFSTRVTLGRDAGLITLLLLSDALPLPEAPPDGVPVSRLFFFIPPSPRAHLDTLARLSRAITGGSLRTLVDQNASDLDLFQALEAADLSAAAEPQREKSS